MLTRKFTFPLTVLFVATCLITFSFSVSAEPSSQTGSIDLSKIELPPQIEKSQTLTFISDISYPPFEFYKKDNETPIGIDIDIAQAIGEQLGLKVEFKQVKFSSIPLQLSSGQALLAISALTDTKAREKVADFVDYINVYGAIVTRTGDPNAPKTLKDLCGMTVGIQTGVQQAISVVKTQSQKCLDNGHKAININLYPSAPAQILALRSERVNAAVTDNMVGGYIVEKSEGKLTIHKSEQLLGATRNGIAVAKGHENLVAVIEAALENMLKNGTYHKILEKWGALSGAVNKIVVNKPSNYGK